MKALHGLLLRCGGTAQVPEPSGVVRSAWSHLGIGKSLEITRENMMGTYEKG